MINELLLHKIIIMISHILFCTLMSTILLLVTGTKTPIILVPGILGSQIRAKLNKSHKTNSYCFKKYDWYTLWLNWEVFEPSLDNCFLDNAKLIYNDTTMEYQNNYGVQTSIPGFGNTETIEHLDDFHVVPYFHHMVKYLKGLGYETGRSLRGAPYDWRYAADGQVKKGYYNALYDLIEETYSINNNTRVTIIAHSMGGPITHYFLTDYVEENWKQKHIEQVISLSGAYGGTLKTVKALVSGEVEQFITANVRILRDFGRTLPGLVWLLPWTGLWDDKEVIITTPKRHYTAHDLIQLFNDLNYTNGTRMYSELRNISNDIKPPNVTHYCFYGSGVKTTSRIYYEEDFDDIKMEEFGDGDGTVNIRSLMSCDNWNGQQYHRIHLRQFEKVTHLKMLRDKNILKAIKEILN